jgi:protein AATF/BFR2
MVMVAYSYEVHEKLQNFMVPVPAHGSWHEEQIDELFASLLGKGFGDTDGQGEIEGAEKDSETEGRLEKSMNEGFRVFG